MSARQPTSSKQNQAAPLHAFFEVFAYSRRAVNLVWSTNPSLCLMLACLTILAGMLPAAIAYVGALIVDAVVSAIQLGGTEASQHTVIVRVLIESALVILLSGAQRGLSLCQSLLRAQLGQRVNVMILEKALTLPLTQFENSEFYDKLTRARREASQRPLSLVIRSFGLLQNLVSLFSFAALLLQFSIWALVILLGAGLPAFIAETKFSGEAFRLFRWRSPETRMQLYLESVMAREDHAKEVKLFGLGPVLLDRYQQIFHKLYQQDRALTIRRDTWGFFLGLIGTAALYGAYTWIALCTIASRITLGQMTMYLMLFRQGQSAVSASLSAVGGLYEDNLYLSTLYEFLETPVLAPVGHLTQGQTPQDGIQFQHVTFTYPGANEPALIDINLHIRPGQSLAFVGENGSGKTTLIKLLTRLYTPESGRILLDGTDLQEWDESALRQRIGVIFQDFTRYQLTLGENIGIGDVRYFEDEEKWRTAATHGMADSVIDSLPERYQSQLGKWFNDGRELSGGQWQKIALARAFMRSEADILVLDEPTSAIDAGAEAQIFEHFRTLTKDRIAILISHRFSTVRMADQIIVIKNGRIIEHGNHAQLMQINGQYAHLFSLQAKGYQ